MADPTAKAPRSRSDTGFPGARPPRWAFFKGLLAGAVIEVPTIALGVWGLARLGVGNADAPYAEVLRLTAVFTGLAGVLTAAGIGRLAAYASIEGGRRRAMLVGARAHAVAGAALVLIAAIPLGHLPARPIGFTAILGAGLVVGAILGAAIGLVCGGTATTVFALARKPSDALRQLVDAPDLARLSAAVRDRTSKIFSGMFDPAEPPPSEPPKPRSDRKT